MEMVQAIEKFGHLEIYRSDQWEEYAYSAKSYFVVNTKTNAGYRATKYLDNLMLAKVIKDHKFDRPEQVIKALADKQFTLFSDREGTLSELGIS